MGFYRSKDEKILLGLCGGIADKTNTNAGLVRMAFILITGFTGGLILPLYALSILLPRKSTESQEITSQSKDKSQIKEQKELQNNEEPIMVAEGNTGQVNLYSDRIIITRDGILAKLNHWNKGSKEIPLDQIASIQLKESGSISAGYIRFGQSGYMESKGGVFSAATDENSVNFNKGKDKEFKDLKNKINELRKKKEKDKNKKNESAIERLKQKLVEDKISEEEFKKKKKLLEE